ncbi:sigma-54-dependent Fis family transcriptional regulator [Rhodoferax koreense]|uniref:Sigma-54-dependent Fis family transcriptional regulator n=1 Tax=Rhodoferax koreensis TaxID=1842727 RepID=A0A1P8JX87_9BURK|nr:sigma-54-dependent Fis family transcriptional regulator [Rhodoferax koreense]
MGHPTKPQAAGHLDGEVGRWPGALAHDADAVRAMAMKSMFERLESLCEGALAVNLDAEVVWINEKYARKLGQPSAAAAIGQPVENIIPNSQMREVARTGRPIVLDIMPFGDEHLVVTRMPIRDDAGQLIGAVGFVLYNHLEGLKPVMHKMAQLQHRLKAAEKELADSRRAKYSLASFLGISPAAVETKRQARRAAQLDTTVLLTGETGTGKELLAHAIHNVSGRAHLPFVSVNAAAIPESLLEAELFGAAPGAYTGADRRGRDGKFKLADGGTLFLDEIGDMPPALQAKLLRVLQEQEIEPLGANRLVRVDVRVIAATSLDLAARVADGRFRSDLFYRLNVLSMSLPPLRERLQDLPLLVERLLEDISLRIGQPLEIAPEAFAVLARHDWPGNVRELRNVVERALLMHETQRLDAAHLASVLPSPTSDAGAIAPATPAPATAQIEPLSRVVEAAERRAIAEALQRTKGNKAAAAAALGISRAALYQKLGAARG